MLLSPKDFLQLFCLCFRVEAYHVTVAINRHKVDQRRDVITSYKKSHIRNGRFVGANVDFVN